jgi:hypothetical protein
MGSQHASICTRSVKVWYSRPHLATNSSLIISIGISGKQNVNASLTLSRCPVQSSPVHAAHVAYLATPSSALKQSSKFLLCLFEAWSLSILRFVVLWNVWKHVLHLTVWAAAFYMQRQYSW